jgi:formate transporter
LNKGPAWDLKVNKESIINWGYLLNKESKVKETKPDTKSSSYEPALTIDELNKKVSALGIKKANTNAWQLVILGILAGVYIGFGGHIFLVALEQGMGRIIGGAVFSVGLVLVVIAGAELFTGNIIMVVSTVLSLNSVSMTLKNWVSVYLGNFIGSVFLAYLVWSSGLLGSLDHLNSVGQLAVKVSQSKLALPFMEAFIRGILCNVLVILAIITATIAKDIISKIVCCLLPVMVFVASGFEHCIANMYLIPLGQLAQGVTGPGLLNMFHNVIPVTLGNIVGGVLILAIHPNRIRQFVFIVKNKDKLRGDRA